MIILYFLDTYDELRFDEEMNVRGQTYLLKCLYWEILYIFFIDGLGVNVII